MKITLQKIAEGQDEVIIRYMEKTKEIDELIQCIEKRGEKILAEADGGKVLIAPTEVLYLESVDDAVYVYTNSVVAKTGLTLTAAESIYGTDGFFRCSKSMVINIYRIEYLKSISGNRVDVTMDNGEHVIISRRYVKALRSILKGEQ